MQAVINASSEGTKLRPLSCNKAPFMLSVADKSLIERLIENLKYHDITDIIILINYMSDSVTSLGNGEKWGVKITYVSAMFSDGALKMCYRLLQEEFLYFSKPVFADINYTKLTDYHRRKGAYATICCEKGVSKEVVTDKNGAVRSIKEKRLWNKLGRGSIGTGIFILKRDIIRFLPEETNVEITENVFPAVLRSGKNIFVYNISDCEAVGDTASLMRANFKFLEKNGNEIIVSDTAIVEPGALLENPCYIGNKAHIHKGAKIGANSIIGEKSVVLEGGNIKRSIILKGCRIEKNASLRGCVIDEGSVIGENSCVFEQAIIGFNSKIGRDCTVKSFVKIWPEKETEDGSVISENIMWGQKKRKTLFEKGKICGVVNVDITPRFATVLGECLGCVAEMGEVGISTDGTPSSLMLRDAIVSGLMSQGASVKDFGEQPLPITRSAVMFYMLKAAVAINVYTKEGEEWAEICIIGQEGVDVDENMRDRLEGLYERGNFIYPEAKNICEPEHHFEYKLYYLKGLIKKLNKKSYPMKILLYCPASWGRRLIVSAMADLGVTVSIYSPMKETVGEKEFCGAVREGGFDIGFILDIRCEKLKLALCERGVIPDEVYDALCALIVMKKYKGAKIFAPVTASRALEKLGENHGGEIIRTKSAKEEMMRHLSGTEEYLSEQFIMHFDAVGAVVKITEYLIANNITLDNLLKQLPKISMSESLVEIPQEDIDKALENVKLMDNSAEDIEGVKITFDKGWVVVVPDMYKEAVRVVAEGTRAEIAKELCDICIKKIKE